MLNFEADKIEKILNYKFKDKNLLKTAFTHSSYANDNNIQSNQRLEFLGDSVLNFIVADFLYQNFDVEEGKMSKWRSKIVNCDSLSNVISKLKLEKYIILGKSIGNTTLSKSVLEDLFESIVGAIYLDGGLTKTKNFIKKCIDLNEAVEKKDTDYKTKLQEIVQKVKGSNLVYFTYEIPRQPGYFCAELYINDIFVARTTSTSKKQAQIECAKLALKNKEEITKILK